jgi:hypothetical protein
VVVRYDGIGGGVLVLVCCGVLASIVPVLVCGVVCGQLFFLFFGIQLFNLLVTSAAMIIGLLFDHHLK